MRRFPPQGAPRRGCAGEPGRHRTSHTPSPPWLLVPPLRFRGSAEDSGGGILTPPPRPAAGAGPRAERRRWQQEGTGTSRPLTEPQRWGGAGPGEEGKRGSAAARGSANRSGRRAHAQSVDAGAGSGGGGARPEGCAALREVGAGPGRRGGGLGEKGRLREGV